MAPHAEEVLKGLWNGYASLAPDAARVHSLLRARGDTVVNDHVAFRTLNLPGVDMSTLVRPFVALGWVEQPDRYAFEDKCLQARWLLHANAELPKVFVSELLVEHMPVDVAELLGRLVAQVPRDLPGTTAWLTAGRPWAAVSIREYQRLLEVSEYAAWVAAFGICANHFTVLVNALKSFPSLADLNAFLMENGFELNGAGGLIKGSAAVLLEQSSTMANTLDWPFADGTLAIRSCYHEFACRHPDPATGRLYQGFVPSSANRIFESTHTR